MKLLHEDIHQRKVASEACQSCPNLPRLAKDVALGSLGGIGREKVILNERLISFT